MILSYVLVLWPQGMWDLNSLTRDQTLTPCIGRGGLNYWTAREVPTQSFLRGGFDKMEKRLAGYWAN